jgi:hypothetical protein
VERFKGGRTNVGGDACCGRTWIVTRVWVKGQTDKRTQDNLKISNDENGYEMSISHGQMRHKDDFKHNRKQF